GRARRSAPAPWPSGRGSGAASRARASRLRPPRPDAARAGTPSQAEPPQPLFEQPGQEGRGGRALELCQDRERSVRRKRGERVDLEEGGAAGRVELPVDAREVEAAERSEGGQAAPDELGLEAGVER